MATLQDSGGNNIGGNQTARSPLHVVTVPQAPISLGSYRIASTTGTIAAALAASAQLFYVRWTDATRCFVLKKFRAQFQCLTAFTAATLTDFGFDLFRATAISAGGGGTDLGATAKPRMNTSMGASLLDSTGLMRISTTAALTAITTLDGIAIAQSVGDAQRVNPATGTEEQRVNDPTLTYLFSQADGDHPLVLKQNEGLVLRNRAVWPAAGTGIVTVEMAWDEMLASAWA
jgi:hypothetical protein